MKCKAHLKSGKPCSAWAIKGGTVCRTHGGSAPQVIASAKMRLAALVSPAITELTRLMKTSKLDPVRLGCVKDILDRTGHKAVDVMEITSRDATILTDLSTETLQRIADELEAKRAAQCTP